MSDFIGVGLLSEYPELFASTQTKLGAYYISFERMNIVCQTPLSKRAVIVVPRLDGEPNIYYSDSYTNRRKYLLYCLRLMNENPEELDKLLVYAVVKICPFCNTELLAPLSEINYCHNCGKSRDDIINMVMK